MHRDYVGKPKRQVGEIVSQDFLDFAAEGLPFFAIHFGADLVGQRVDARVAIVSTVRAVGREALAGEGKLKEIRIVIGANPAEIDDLEVALGYVGEESGNFQGAKFEFNADAMPWVLEGGADEAGWLRGGRD